MQQAYFLTVDWCNQGHRGIFCDTSGGAFRKDTSHTLAEMDKILGPFSLILAPASQLLNEMEVAKCTQFIPLAEYTNCFGIAILGDEGRGRGPVLQPGETPGTLAPVASKGLI